MFLPAQANSVRFEGLSTAGWYKGGQILAAFWSIAKKSVQIFEISQGFI